MFKGMIAGVSSFCIYLLGGWDTAVMFLFIFMTIDIITGVIKAIINKNLSSKKMFNGLAKKMLIVFIIVIATMLDKLAQVDIARDFCVIYYICCDTISIFENITEIGVPIPSKLTEILDIIKNK